MKQKYKKIILSVFLALFTVSSLGFSKDDIGIEKAQANTVSGYTFEGIVFYASITTQAGLFPVYRLYNAASADHIYTASEDEKTAALAAGYILEPAGTTGVAFYASLTAQTGLVPVYRVLGQSIKSRLYTTSETEKDTFINNLSYILNPPETNGIAFYANTESQTGLVPIYRFHNEASGDYLYTANQNEKDTTVKPAADISNLGPEISVGLWSNNRDGLKDSPFKIKASKNYNIKDKDGNILAQITASTVTSVSSYTTSTVTYVKDDSGGGGSHKKKKKKKKKKSSKSTSKNASKSVKAKVLGASTVKKAAKKKLTKKKKTGWLRNLLIPTAYAADKQIVTYTEYLKIKVKKSDDVVIEKELGIQELYFDSTDGDNGDMIFDIYRPGSSYDQYRGKIKVKYTDNDNIWIINILPLEQYIWGDGEMTGTGPIEHTKTMAMIFRTYGYWYIQYATKYLPYGFRIRSDSGSQIYSGYDHETNYPNIKTAAQSTQGKIVTYKGDVALTPYSSWTDGKTRSYKERWGSADYPWCASVPDPYGKHPTLTTDQLVAAGNHMVGLSAHGSLNLSGDDYKWDYQKILKYYYTGIDITAKY